jgi:hypothetical protein
MENIATVAQRELHRLLATEDEGPFRLRGRSPLLPDPAAAQAFAAALAAGGSAHDAAAAAGVDASTTWAALIDLARGARIA